MNNVSLLKGLVAVMVLLLAVVSWSWYRQAEELRTVAVVGDAAITEAEWLDELKRTYGDQVLNDMINRQVVREQAKKLGISVDPKRVEAEVERLQESYAREENFPASLKTGDEPDWEAIRREVEHRQLLAAIAAAEVTVSEEEMRAYYEAHRSEFVQPARARVWQIVVATREEAEEVRRELKDGANFATLAKERSLHTETALLGGDLGWVSLEGNDLPDELREAAAVLPIGEDSEPLPVKNGFAVIRVLERRPASTPAYDEVREQIRQELALSRVSLDDVLKRLRELMGVRQMGE